MSIFSKYPEGEIVEITNSNIIDTTDKESIKKFKHNLKVLKKRLLEENKIDRYILIREDDFFPYDNKWIVNSNQTELEDISLAITTRLKERIAAKKANIKTKIGDLYIPPKKNELESALNSVDKSIGMISMPTHFRSTKHFTINTPLSITGNYNSVSAKRNFIVLDEIDNFINSGYVYSIAPHDAYLDVSHEPLELSSKATILIQEEKYETLKEKYKEELKNKRVIIFKGDETIAQDMFLTQIGVLPSRVGAAYLDDTEDIVYKKTEEGLQELAKEKNIYYDKSHGGGLKIEGGGHFSNYFDDKNNDWNNSLENLVEFLKEKFPNIKDTITPLSLTSLTEADKLLDRIDNEELLAEALKEYNQKVKENIELSRKSYLEDRKTIPKSISDIFKETTKRIDLFYKNNEYTNYSKIELEQLEEQIRLYFQAPTVKEQLEKAILIQRELSIRNELNTMFNDNEEKVEIKELNR